MRWRIALGLLLAMVLIALLQWWVTRPPAIGPQPPPSPAGERLPAEPDHAAEGRAVIRSVSGVAAEFHHAAFRSRLPFGCAPVFRILAGGAVQVPEAPPLPSTPGAAVVQRVGVLLPHTRFADLTPSERSSLLAIWSHLAGRAPLEKDRIHTHGVAFRPGELELLLRWLR